MLELGVGGGHHLAQFTEEFHCTGLDLSADMLELSKELNPGVGHVLGDMRTVRLGGTFDAVLIHDSASYLLSEEDLRETFKTARAHLRPEGVILIAPDWVQENFPDGWLFSWEREKDGIQVEITEFIADPDPSDTLVESAYTYTITRDDVVTVERDTHITGLFPINTWTQLLEDAGFSVELRPLPPNEGGWGCWLFVGVLGSDNGPKSEIA